MWVSGGCQEGEQQSTEMQIFSESVEGLRDSGLRITMLFRTNISTIEFMLDAISLEFLC